jgi:Mn2+/Fe2+ NRAMP family transporter
MKIRETIKVLGPGLAVAATGVGAGDLIAASVAGSTYGFALVWAAVLGAIFKFGLNEGLARWQLATGTTLLEGWANHLGRWVQWIFFVYLIVWSFVVGGALINACALAAYAISPAIPFWVWGVLHSLAAVLLVLFGGYQTFERSIKLFIGVMFIALVGSSILVAPPLESVSRSFTDAAVPIGGGALILGVLGGVGGSVTLLSYGYWIREKGWRKREELSKVRLDLGVAYLLTGLFGIAVIWLAAHLLSGGEPVARSAAAARMSEMLSGVIGPTGRWLFLVGFWGAVRTSMLGVWQGVPYLFADFFARLRNLPSDGDLTRRPSYRLFLLWIAVAPMALLYFDRPILLIVIYSVLGALFIPFLALTLLYMNGRREWVGELRNGWASRLVLGAAVVLFLVIAYQDIVAAFRRLG